MRNQRSRKLYSSGPQPEHTRTTSTSHSRSTTYNMEGNTTFTNPFASSSSSPSPSSSASSSRRNSLIKDLTPEERIAAGLEYMSAFLASRASTRPLSPATTRPSISASSPSSVTVARTLGSEEAADRMLKLQMKRKNENERAMSKAIAWLT